MNTLKLITNITGKTSTKTIGKGKTMHDWICD